MTPLSRYVLETLVTLLAVAGLAVVILYTARRSGVGRPTGPLSLAGRLALDARRAIYLVRVGETVFVIGASEAGLTKLGELAASELAAGALESGKLPEAHAFKSVLDRLARRPLARDNPPTGDVSPGPTAAERPPE